MGDELACQTAPFSTLKDVNLIVKILMSIVLSGSVFLGLLGAIRFLRARALLKTTQGVDRVDGDPVWGKNEG